MSYKKFNLDEDISTNSYFLSELVQIDHFWITGGYYNLPTNNIKYPHHYTEDGVSGSYYVEVFDKNASDRSAIRLASFSYGYTSSSAYHSGAGFVGTEKQHKLKMYRMFAKRLLGNENKKFTIEGRELNEAIFISIPRNQFKDGIIPNSTTIHFFSGTMIANKTFGVAGQSMSDGFSSPFPAVSIKNEFAGRYTTLLHAGNNPSIGWHRLGSPVGLVFSEAGIYVIDPDVRRGLWSGSFDHEVLAKGVSGSTYRDLLNGVKSTFSLIQFSNYTKVQSTYYKCTAAPSEFNYSSNPSFVNRQGEIITALSSTTPSSYISQIALLGQNNEVIGVAKLAKPIKKNPHIGFTITVRLDH
jgi:hypothetical protein